MKPMAHASRRRSGRPGGKRLVAGSRTPVPVLFAYADIATVRDAMSRVVAQLRHGDMQPMLWRFDQLAQPKWHDMAIADANRAHLLVLALGEHGTLTPPVEQWLAALATRAGGAAVNTLVWFGVEDAWTVSLRQTRAASAPSRESANAVVAAATRIDAASALPPPAFAA